MGIMRWTMESHGRSPSATNRQTNYPRRKIGEAGRSSPTALMESMFNLMKSYLPYTVCNIIVETMLERKRHQSCFR